MAHSKVVICRTRAEAAHLYRQYQLDVDPIVRELVEIEIRSFPRYSLDRKTGTLKLIDWYRPPGMEDERAVLLVHLQLIREKYGFSEADVAEIYGENPC